MNADDGSVEQVRLPVWFVRLAGLGRARAGCTLSLLLLGGCRFTDRETQEPLVFGAVLRHTSSTGIADELMVLEDEDLPFGRPEGFDRQAFADFEDRASGSGPTPMPEGVLREVDLVDPEDSTIELSHAGFDPSFRHAVVAWAEFDGFSQDLVVDALAWDGYAWSVTSTRFAWSAETFPSSGSR